MTHWLLCNCTFAKVALNIKTWSPVFPIFCGAKKGIIECSLLAGVFLALLPLTSTVRACFCSQRGETLLNGYGLFLSPAFLLWSPLGPKYCLAPLLLSMGDWDTCQTPQSWLGVCLRCVCCPALADAQHRVPCDCRECCFLVLSPNRWVQPIADCLWNFVSDSSLALLPFCKLLEHSSAFTDSLICTTRRCRVFEWRHADQRSPGARGTCRLGGVLHLSRGIRRAVLWDVPLGLQKRDSESRAVQPVCALYLQRTQRDLWPRDRWDSDSGGRRTEILCRGRAGKGPWSHLLAHLPVSSHPLSTQASVTAETTRPAPTARSVATGTTAIPPRAPPPTASPARALGAPAAPSSPRRRRWCAPTVLPAPLVSPCCFWRKYIRAQSLGDLQILLGCLAPWLQSSKRAKVVHERDLLWIHKMHIRYK